MSDRPRLYESCEKWVQDADSCLSDDCWQDIDVFTQDNGAGAYIAIKTERWAIDEEDIDRFCEALKRVCRRVGDGEKDPYDTELQVFTGRQQGSSPGDF